MKKLMLLSVLLCSMLVLTGCWDVEDIDELYLPTIMTFDKDNESSNYEVNISMMNFSGGKVLNDFFKLKEDTVSESIESSKNRISGNTSMALLQTIVLGEGFSKNSTYDLVNWLYKENISSKLSMCVYEGNPSELIEQLQKNEKKDSGKNQGEQSESQNKNSEKDSNDKIRDVIDLISTKHEEGYEVIQNLEEFSINNEREGCTALLPTIKIIDDNVEIIGTTIFKDYRNIGNVNYDDTKYLSLLRGIKTSKTIKFENIDLKNTNIDHNMGIFNKNNIDKKLNNQNNGPKDKISGTVSAINKRKIDVEKSKGKYIFTVKIDLKGDISENNNGSINLITNKENLKAIEKEINKQVEAECNKLISKTKKDINYDIFDLYKYAKVKHPEVVTELKEENFFKNSEIKVEVNTKIENKSLFN